MPVTEYTNCVEREAFRPFTPIDAATVTAIALALAGLLTPGGGIFAALALIPFLAKLKEYLDFVIDGKLICLHDPVTGSSDRCAVGTVVALGDPESFLWAVWDAVVHQSLDALVDNDSGISLILYPHTLRDFADKVGQDVFPVPAGGPTKWTSTSWANSNVLQGDLIRPLPDEPGPFDESNTGNHDLITREHADLIGGAGPMFNGPIAVDILHTESEGARAWAMRETIERIQSFGFGSKFCKGSLFGKIVCRIVQILLAPVIIVAALIAAVAAPGGSREEGRIGPGDGVLELGDFVAVKGRWVQDADAKHGWHEFHPLRAVQRISPRKDRLTMSYEIGDIKEWMKLVCEVPPNPNSRAPGTTDPPPRGSIKGLTPEQESVRRAQARPEHGWLVHPLLDSCAPAPPVRPLS